MVVKRKISGVTFYNDENESKALKFEVDDDSDGSFACTMLDQNEVAELNHELTEWLIKLMKSDGEKTE